jgi:hypothetical protein
MGLAMMLALSRFLYQKAPHCRISPEWDHLIS